MECCGEIEGKHQKFHETTLPLALVNSTPSRFYYILLLEITRLSRAPKSPSCYSEPLQRRWLIREINRSWVRRDLSGGYFIHILRFHALPFNAHSPNNTQATQNESKLKDLDKRVIICHKYLRYNGLAGDGSDTCCSFITTLDEEKSGISSASRLLISSLVKNVLRDRDEQGSAQHLEEHDDNGGSERHFGQRKHGLSSNTALLEPKACFQAIRKEESNPFRLGYADRN